MVKALYFLKLVSKFKFSKVNVIFWTHGAKGALKRQLFQIRQATWRNGNNGGFHEGTGLWADHLTTKSWPIKWMNLICSTS